MAVPMTVRPPVNMTAALGSADTIDAERYM
jgi:hypothetical protein